MKHPLSACLILLLLCTPVNATTFDILNNQLKNSAQKEYNKQQINKNKAKNINGRTTQKSNTTNLIKPKPIEIDTYFLSPDGSYTYPEYYGQTFGIPSIMGILYSNFNSKYKLITNSEKPLIIEYKIFFKDSKPNAMVITKSSGNKATDKKFIEDLNNYLDTLKNSKEIGYLNGGESFYIKSKIETIPIHKYTPIYPLDSELNSVPEEFKEYFKNLNTKFDECYKNKADVNGKATVFIKFDKNGKLISTNQKELYEEYVNFVGNSNYTNIENNSSKENEIINSVVEKEIINSISEIFPIDSITNSKFNQFIVVKSYEAKKAPFIKPTDKTITKIGKGIVSGVGCVIAIPFIILYCILDTDM